jgi:RimJ/RimL family protein N-acetyltransferase
MSPRNAEIRALEIQLGQATIRSFRPDDVEAIARYANNRGIWRNLRDRMPHPYSMDDAMRFLELVAVKRPETAFAIALEGEAVGSIGLELHDDVFRRTAEIGYWLGEPFWGRGIATAAVRALTEHALANFDLCRIEAGVYEWNPASARVLEKAGYVLEARLRKSVTKDGQTIDRLIYAYVV